MEKYLQSKFLKKGSLLISGLGFTFALGQYQSRKITAFTRESRAEFGTSVAISNQFVAVGASREEIAKGAVYIHQKNGNNWNFHQK